MKITISVDSAELTYFVGQTIHGAVILDNPSEVKTVGKFHLPDETLQIRTGL